MGIFDGVLFCSDIDGTLVYNGDISIANRQAIDYFMSEGGLFTLSTGRFPCHAFKNFGIKANTHIISVNGTVISGEDGSNILYNSRLSLSLINRLYDYVLSNYTLENFCSADISDMKLVCGERVTKPTNKLQFITYDESTALTLMSDLQNRFGKEVNVSRSWATGVEVICTGSGKGESVQRLKEITDAKLLICAGDYENDLTMLNSADIGYAVANAVPAVKKAANRITASDCKSAIAEIIETTKKELYK